MTTRHPVARRRRLLAGSLGLLLVAALAAPAATFAAHNITGATLNGASSVTVAPGATISLTVSVTTTNGDDWTSTGWRLATSPGSFTCVDTPNHYGSGTYTETFNITAPAGSGSYNLYLAMWDGSNSCSGGAAGSGLYRSNAVVVRLAQTITFAALPDRVLGDADFLVAATSSSGLVVTFSSTTTSVCTVTDFTVHLAAVGSCTIKADQAGNGQYLPAPSVSQSFNVAPAASGGSVTRLAGADRYETAAAISAANFSPGVPVVYIATGANFPDALAGGPVAKIKGGPVLLVQAGAIPAATATELTRLLPANIVILGGTAVVSAAVATALDAYTTGTVTRLAGADRYETAAAISAASFSSPVPVVYIATGANFPDALAGGPVAGIKGGPVLLVQAGVIPAATATELTRLLPTNIVILGGTGVVSAAVATALDAYTTGTVTRLAGADRYETAAAISAASFSSPVPVVYIATGANFPDALAGGPVAGIKGGPVLLVQAGVIPAATATELTRLLPTNIVILGGTAVVSDGVQTNLAAYLAP